MKTDITYSMIEIFHFVRRFRSPRPRSRLLALTPRRALREMRRSALRDRNDESGVDAIARIKAIAAGKISRSAFLDDSDVECSPSAHPLGTAENKENAERMSDSDEDYSPAQPVRRKKNRLVRKSQLETEEAEEAESSSPSPLPKARPRRAVFIDSDSDSEAEEVAKTDDARTDDEDAGDDALVDAMRGLEVKKPSVAPPAPPAPFAPRPAPSRRSPRRRDRRRRERHPSRRPGRRSRGAPRRRRRGDDAIEPPSFERVSERRSLGFRTGQCAFPRVTLNPLEPSGGPRPMRLKGREGGPRSSSPARWRPACTTTSATACAGCGTCSCRAAAGSSRTTWA